MTVLPDGTPEYMPRVERWLVGASMLADREDVMLAAATCGPDDFRDETLGKMWEHLPYLECPCMAHLAQALQQAGTLDEVGAEPRLVELASTQGAWLYAARACLEEHARLVHEWGEKRRRLQALQREAQAIYAGTNNVTPIYDRPEYRGLSEVV